MILLGHYIEVSEIFDGYKALFLRICEYQFDQK